MSVPSFTVEQKRAHVLAYMACAHGTKDEYLQRHGLRRCQLSRWRVALYAGTLEVGFVPRGGFLNDPEMNRELVRLAGEVQRLQQQLQDQAQAHELVVAGKQAEIDSARQAVEAVGKAIALLQSGNGSVGSTTGC